VHILCQKRPTKETYTYQKKPIDIKRDLQRRPVCHKSVASASVHLRYDKCAHIVSKETYKRDVYISKETYSQKRPGPTLDKCDSDWASFVGLC